jgi:glycosyltransferase involved in cell wall biosynthesis
MGQGQPKISCLMVTLDRFELVKRSIDRYCQQTYVNKELIITPDGGSEYRRLLEQYVAGLNRPDIRVVAVREKSSWGQLQNIAMREASGDLLCTWDDDDIYHPDRLTLQHQSLVEHDGAACLLADYLHYFPATRELFWCDYTRLGGLPGSILFRAGLGAEYPATGEKSLRGGDEDFQRAIAAKHKCVLLAGCGHLYVYVCHGTNVWNEEHHRQLVRRLVMPFEKIRPWLRTLLLNLRTQLDGEFPVTLVCRGGKRIELQPKEAAAS